MEIKRLPTLTPIPDADLDISYQQLLKSLDLLTLTIDSTIYSSTIFYLQYTEEISKKVSSMQHWAKNTASTDHGMLRWKHQIQDSLNDPNITEEIDLYEKKFKSQFDYIIYLIKNITNNNYEIIKQQLEGALEQYLTLEEEYMGTLHGALQYINNIRGELKQEEKKITLENYSKYATRFNILVGRYNEIDKLNNNIRKSLSKATTTIAAKKGFDTAKKFIEDIIAFLKKLCCCRSAPVENEEIFLIPKKTAKRSY